MARRASLRASDADRERVTERLRSAAAEGRILAHELEQRLATALRARTYGELDAVVADLPSDRNLAPRPRARRALSHPRPAMLVALVIAIPVIVAAVVAAMVLLMAVAIFWSVLAIVTWRVLGRRAVPGPWMIATRHRHHRGLRAAASRRGLL